MAKEFIEKVIFCILLAGLVVEAIKDIKEKKIYLAVVLVELPVLMGAQYWMGKGGAAIWIASVGIGAFFYLISVITRGQIGKGDALVFCMTGAGVGLYDNLLLIYVAFFLAFLAAVFLWAVRGVNKKYSIPLTPFILCAYLLVAGIRIIR